MKKKFNLNRRHKKRVILNDEELFIYEKLYGT
jgi:hypothetical protein